MSAGSLLRQHRGMLGSASTMRYLVVCNVARHTVELLSVMEGLSVAHEKAEKEVSGNWRDNPFLRRCGMWLDVEINFRAKGSSLTGLLPGVSTAKRLAPKLSTFEGTQLNNGLLWLMLMMSTSCPKSH